MCCFRASKFAPEGRGLTQMSTYILGGSGFCIRTSIALINSHLLNGREYFASLRVCGVVKWAEGWLRLLMAVMAVRWSSGSSSLPSQLETGIRRHASLSALSGRVMAASGHAGLSCLSGRVTTRPDLDKKLRPWCTIFTLEGSMYLPRINYKWARHFPRGDYDNSFYSICTLS